MQKQAHHHTRQLQAVPLAPKDLLLKLRPNDKDAIDVIVHNKRRVSKDAHARQLPPLTDTMGDGQTADAATGPTAPAHFRMGFPRYPPAQNSSADGQGIAPALAAASSLTAAVRSNGSGGGVTEARECGEMQRGSRRGDEVMPGRWRQGEGFTDGGKGRELPPLYVDGALYDGRNREHHRIDEMSRTHFHDGSRARDGAYTDRSRSVGMPGAGGQRNFVEECLEPEQAARGHTHGRSRDRDGEGGWQGQGQFGGVNHGISSVSAGGVLIATSRIHLHCGDGGEENTLHAQNGSTTWRYENGHPLAPSIPLEVHANLRFRLPFPAEAGGHRVFLESRHFHAPLQEPKRKVPGESTFRGLSGTAKGGFESGPHRSPWQAKNAVATIPGQFTSANEAYTCRSENGGSAMPVSDDHWSGNTWSLSPLANSPSRSEFPRGGVEPNNAGRGIRATEER